MNLHFYKENSSFVVEVLGSTGMARVGRGKTLNIAIANFFRAYQKELGIGLIEMDMTCMQLEIGRRARELTRR